MQDPTWRYGVKGPSGGESTSRGYSLLGVVNQLKFLMEARLSEGACTCNFFLPNGRHGIQGGARCRPCNQYIAAMTQLEMARQFRLSSSAVTVANRVFFYRQEDDRA